MKVLMVDDEFDILEQAQIFLEKEVDELEIDIASSPQEALELLENNDYKGIVSDYQMPEMDGLDFLKTVRNKGMDIPFIIFTGKGREEVAMEALNLGADRYLQKGGDPRSQYGVLGRAIVQEVKRRRVEKEAKTYYKNLRETFNSLREIAFLLDEDHNILLANSYAEDFFGKSEEELKNFKCYELAHESDDPVEWCPLERTVESKEMEEYEFYDSIRDKYFLARTHPIIEDGDKPHRFVHQVLDITERREMEKRLREERERLRNAIEDAPLPIMLHASDGKILQINDVWTEITGYSKEDIPTISDWIERAYGDSREKTEKVIQNLYEENGRTYEGEFKISIKNGEKRIWDFKSTNLGSLPDGRSLVISMATDMTEKKEEEDREDFLQSILRHDVRNKAQIIKGYHDLLGDYELPEEAKHYVKKANKVAQESIDLIEKVSTLREIGGDEKIEKTPLKVVLKNVISELELQAANKNIEIEYEYLSFKVRGGPLLEELFSNLLENSIKHSDGSKVKITAQSLKDEILVKLEDNGKGISDEYKEKIFEKGFKSGETKGSGLGLYIVKEIAESYGGKIEVKDSELGGARFDIHLKKAD